MYVTVHLFCLFNALVIYAILYVFSAVFINYITSTQFQKIISVTALIVCFLNFFLQQKGIEIFCAINIVMCLSFAICTKYIQIRILL